MRFVRAYGVHCVLGHNGPTGNSEMELVLLENLKEGIKMGGKERKAKKLATNRPHQTANQHTQQHENSTFP